jgi:hypothetical protein
MCIICVNNHKVLDLPPPLLFMFSPHHYEYLRHLAILEEDADKADLGDSTGPDQSHF